MELSGIKNSRKYSSDELKKAAVILHPKQIERYGVTHKDVGMIFEEWSNFTRLTHPIIDSLSNEYWDSEAYYMAQRFSDPTIKKMIALCSTKRNFSKQVAYLLKDQMEEDLDKRIEYMRNAIREKFFTNPSLRKLLIKTKWRDIIELTYWNDTTFWITHDTLEWSNILGKLLVETRELCMKSVS